MEAARHYSGYYSLLYGRSLSQTKCWELFQSSPSPALFSKWIFDLKVLEWWEYKKGNFHCKINVELRSYWEVNERRYEKWVRGCMRSKWEDIRGKWVCHLWNIIHKLGPHNIGLGGKSSTKYISSIFFSRFIKRKEIVFLFCFEFGNWVEYINI